MNLFRRSPVSTDVSMEDSSEVTSDRPEPNPAWRIAAAFAVVYLVWGSTYLAIRIGVAAEPPFLFAGIRFLVAGALLALWVLVRGGRLRPTARELGVIGLTAGLMLVAGNGLVTWAERSVPSDQTALLVASSALWMALFGSLGARGEAVSLRSWIGLLLGLGGLVLLVGLGLHGQHAQVGAYLALLLSPLCWAAGSIIGRRKPLGLGTLATAALQMLVAGLVLATIGLARGEASYWTGERNALLALAYLILFGSCLAYAAYFWLVGQVAPARLATYAYVNPTVAVLLGWLLLGERLDGPQLVGSALILTSVLAVNLPSRR